MKQYEGLVKDIENAYKEPVSTELAEKLAAKFLVAQITVGAELQKVDLDCRMKKTGVKAVRAAIYMDTATKGDKKPSDVLIEATINMNEIVVAEQKALDEAEVLRDALYNYLSVFKESHLYFRGISKGKFE